MSNSILFGLRRKQVPAAGPLSIRSKSVNVADTDVPVELWSYQLPAGLIEVDTAGNTGVVRSHTAFRGIGGAGGGGTLTLDLKAAGVSIAAATINAGLALDTLTLETFMAGVDAATVDVHWILRAFDEAGALLSELESYDVGIAAPVYDDSTDRFTLALVAAWSVAHAANDVTMRLHMIEALRGGNAG